MTLHQPTVLIVQVCIAVLSCMLMLVAALVLRDLREIRLWAFGSLLVCLGFALGSIESSPPWLNGIVSYGAIALGLGVVLRGLLLFSRRELPHYVLALLVLAAMAMPAYYLYVVPDVYYRLMSALFLGGGIALACAVALLAPAGPLTQTAMRVTAGFFALMGVSVLVQAGHLALLGGNGLDVAAAAARASEASGVMQLLVTLAQVGVTCGLLMMVAYRYADQLHRLAVTDGLTGIMNRAALESIGRRMLRRAQRRGRPLCLAMIDADHFKGINDHYGHQAGDEVLRHLAQVLAAQVRPRDLVTRYGGEEFALLLDEMDGDQALPVLDRLRANVEQQAVPWGSRAISYSVSIGVAGTDAAGHDLERLVAQADAALYRAKSQGRNRVVADGAGGGAGATGSG